MYPRLLEPTKTYNVFLFGARGTGKTSLVKDFYPAEERYLFDLLDIELEDRLAKNPKLLQQTILELDSRIKYIIIDEIQKLPRLLDLVHQTIASTSFKRHFILTGSSARKLKRGSANMLAGRAFVNYLYPLTFPELGHDFDLDHYLHWGGLPEIYHFKRDKDKQSFLKTYALVYLKEEVWAEHLIKNLNPFRHFLELAAQANTEIINYTKIAKQIGIDTKTVQNYFQILEDTHLCFIVDAYHTSIRKRLIKAPKFYLFDLGVKRALDNTLSAGLVAGTYAYGKAFEHFIIQQIITLSYYKNRDFKFFYMKTERGAEVDLVIEKPDKTLVLIEAKSSRQVSSSDIPHLITFKKELKKAQAFCLSLDELSRTEKDVKFRFWRDGINEILD